MLPGAASTLARPVQAALGTRGGIRAPQRSGDVEPHVDPDAPTAWSPGHPPVHIGDYVDPDGPQLTPEEGRTMHVGEWLDPEDEPDNDGL